MAGIPRPVDDLPNGSVSVRVIRGAMTDNIADQTVKLHVGSEVQSTKTDPQGRAQFNRLPPGALLMATAVVDGERLESQEFPAPGLGGIRLLLVASGGAVGVQTTAPGSQALVGEVTLGGQSRIILQPGEENVTIYYLLEIVNTEPEPVRPTTPFAFEMPTGTSRIGIMQESTELATVDGPRVQVSGPFQPGTTLVNVGAEIRVTTGTLALEQRFPVALEAFTVIVTKAGDTILSSPYISEQREMVAQGEVFIAGAGTRVAAGQPLTLSVSGMPHHSSVPRYTALALAAGIIIAGILTGARPRSESATAGPEQGRLVARRERLLTELVRLEREPRDDKRYATHREEIMATLEHVYGALDSDGVGPEPGTRAGVAT